jgi:hypothetical protein
MVTEIQHSLRSPLLQNSGENGLANSDATARKTPMARLMNLRGSHNI